MNRLLRSGYLRRAIEIAFILLIFSIISFYNESFAHSAVELFTIVIAWLVFLLTRTESRKMNSTLFFSVGIAYAYSALSYFTIMLLRSKNYSLAGIESDSFSSQLELFGRVFESLSVFLALLWVKYFHKISVLLISLTILFVVSFAVLIGNFLPWCSICLCNDLKNESIDYCCGYFDRKSVPYQQAFIWQLQSTCNIAVDLSHCKCIFCHHFDFYKL